VKALAAAAVLFAAALPLAVATEAGAVTGSLTGFCFTAQLATGNTYPGSCQLLSGVGEGASIYVLVQNTSSSPFAHDGASNVTVTTTAPGVTFLSATELSTNLLQAALVTTGASTPGTYPVTVSDSNGTFTSTSSSSTELTIYAPPTVTSVSPTSIPSTQTKSVTITGSGYECLLGFSNCAPGGAAGPTVSFLNATTGIPLTTGTVTVAGGSTSETGTTLTLNVTGTNKYTSAAAPAGSYNLTILNPNQGTVTFSNALTITAAGISNISPSAILATASAVPVTITGAGFDQFATVQVNCQTGHYTPGTVNFVSPNTLTTTLTAAGGPVGPCDVVVTNTAPGDGSMFTGTGILGVGATSASSATSGNGVATISGAALSPNAPIVPGSSTSVTETITGLGFSNGSTVQAIEADGATPDTHIGFTCTSSSTGTTLTCAVTGSANAAAGTDSIQVTNGTGVSSLFANALTVAGPSISSVAPTALSAGAPIGTTLTFTGTGFNSTAQAVLTHGTAGTSLTGLAYFAVTSPTTATLALTSTLSGAEVGTQKIQVSENNANGIVVLSAPFTFTVDATPQVTSITYPTTTPATTNIGLGAVSYPVTIGGTNFTTGATIGSFVNYYGVADTGVTATVTSVTSTAIKATITVAATDANLSVGYKVTLTDGGVWSVPAGGTGAITLAAGPTISAVTPSTATASGTTSFVITGTNFATGAIVTTTPTNGTCGTTTLTSSTSLSVTCTLGVAGTTATSLLVTNLNGGSATSAAVLAAATAPAAVSPFTSGASGTAKVGKTSTIVVSGGGFYGQPKATSSAGIKAVVSGDTGTALTVRVTVSKNVPGEHTLTFTLANGSVFKANFKITK
jgi:hypothetical protein